jgi:hypothetical protein
MIGHLGVAYFIGYWRESQLFTAKTHREILTRVFDSATFAGSTMLLIGLMDDGVMKAIGSTRPFLLVAGIAGVAYGLHALAPPRD